MSSYLLGFQVTKTVAEVAGSDQAWLQIGFVVNIKCRVEVMVKIVAQLDRRGLCLQGGERTKTVEEIAEGEKARLERLETERIKRMRGIGGASDEDKSGGEDGAGGGYRARRQKRKREEAAATEHGPSGTI